MAQIPASENEFPSLLFAEGAAPSTPAAGLVICYVKSDGLLYCKDDAGTETAYGALPAHLADTADAHDASAISVLDTAAVFTATDVEAALKELYDTIAGGGISPTIFAAKGDILAASANDTPAIRSVGTDGYRLIADSGQSTGLNWQAPAVTYDVITSDETGVTDATLVNTGLSFSVISGVRYRFRFDIIYRSGSLTVGLKLGLTTPTFTVFNAWARINIVTAANAAGVYDGTIRASGGSISAANVEATGTDYPAVVEGIIIPSANGTLMLQYAAETTGSTVTMKAGSCAELVNLG